MDLRFRAIALLLVGPLAVAMAAGPRDREIAAAIKTRVEAKRSVGMVVATIDADGTTSLAAYGSPGAGARPLDADTVFEIGSITKVFTAILLADMADRGEVRLDDPVEKFLPPGARVPARGGSRITLLHLATHSSSLPRLPDNLRPADIRNPYADYTAEQMFEFLSRYELPRDVGASYEYSNLGAGLLGQALARRANRSYEALVKERILDPLKMDHTGVTLTPWMRDHLAKGHDAQGRPASNWDVPALAGAGALRSTMNDMLRFARANLDPSGGRLHRVIQRTHERRLPAGRDDMSIGMGWHIRRASDRDVHWHNGGTGGYRTWIGFDRSRKTAAIVLTNSAMPNDDLGFELVTPR
jgi:CubicO group peptidase (beta-lactamase class C family)